MPAKIWYNGRMHDMTALQMVTFVNGEKKHLSKGVTFVNGEKKILWQTGNYALDSWQLSELQYPNSAATPVGLYTNKDSVIFTVGDYVARSNVSNISAPYNENCVKNGGAFSWDCTAQTYNNESFITGYSVATGTNTGSGIVVTYTTGLNKMNINTENMSVVSGLSGSSVANGTFCYSNSTYGWIAIVAMQGRYRVYKNSNTVLADILTNGYSGTATPALPFLTKQSDTYILFSYEYQATSGADKTYGIKRLNLTNGSSTDLASGLTSPVTAIMVDGEYVLYTSGKNAYRVNEDGTVNHGSYTDTKNIVLVGRIGYNYYYGAIRPDPANTSRGFLDVVVLNRSDFSYRETNETTIKAKEVNAIPYVSNNKYLCFGTWHGISFTYYVAGNTGGGGSSISFNSGGRQVTTWTEVEYRVNRIQGY